MTNHNIDLITKKNEKIIGVKLTDGTMGEIKYVNTKTGPDCVFPAKIATNKDGSHTFILINKKEINSKLQPILEHSFNHWFELD
jgi:hypothetical protein